jgi:hypothetical protein
MTDEHFSAETIQRFFRSELPRDQVRGFVRHLMRQCPRCRRLLRQVSQRQEFRLLIRSLEGGAAQLDSQTRLAPERPQAWLG